MYRLYSASIFFLNKKKREASTLGLAGSQEKAGSCKNKMLALYYFVVEYVS
jgi:hypothetical protein